ncbi:hypothetical protein VITFI_CDS1807 [Vitreoscilla filiformis]|uniref:Uncharacterized protein n=1 Tax=Vitreoscilla filiformis TaxID=63 RepID=A0A221KF28_VITFI|nr:hypothetical protein VITFI_CDS1807 [Vitreoscilla filiformis]
MTGCADRGAEKDRAVCKCQDRGGQDGQQGELQSLRAQPVTRLARCGLGASAAGSAWNFQKRYSLGGFVLG